jgi:hypothetical protein
MVDILTYPPCFVTYLCFLPYIKLDTFIDISIHHILAESCIWIKIITFIRSTCLVYVFHVVNQFWDISLSLMEVSSFHFCFKMHKSFTEQIWYMLKLSHLINFKSQFVLLLYNHIKCLNVKYLLGNMYAMSMSQSHFKNMQTEILIAPVKLICIWFTLKFYFNSVVFSTRIPLAVSFQSWCIIFKEQYCNTLPSGHEWRCVCYVLSMDHIFRYFHTQHPTHALLSQLFYIT